MITLEDLLVLIDKREEDEHLEFKEAKISFGFDKLCQYCAAIANEGGGHLCLGVSDRHPRRVVGTQAFQNPQAVKHP